MGSVWQALAFGFVGLTPLGEVLTLDPRLPAGWSALELNLHHHGVAARIRIEPHAVVVVAAAPVELELRGRRVQCGRGRTELAIETRGEI